MTSKETTARGIVCPKCGERLKRVKRTRDARGAIKRTRTCGNGHSEITTERLDRESGTNADARGAMAICARTLLEELISDVERRFSKGE